jgi:hypothetical protein
MVFVQLQIKVSIMTVIFARLNAVIGSKSDYLPKTLEQARADFISRAKKTVIALRDGQVRPYHPAPMARQQKRTKLFCVKIGYGGNNAYMPNSLHKASQLLKYPSAEQAASDIETVIIPAAEAGEFDEGLQAVLEQHKKLAERRRTSVALAEDAPVTGVQRTEAGSVARVAG